MFVCEHGAAKSIIAAAEFERMAKLQGLNFTIISRGTTPDPEVAAGHQDVLHAIVAAIAADDMKALEPYFTEDVVLNIHGLAPIDGSWTGRADVIAAATRNFQKLAEQQPRIETILDQGDNVAWLLAESGFDERAIEHTPRT